MEFAETSPGEDTQRRVLDAANDEPDPTDEGTGGAVTDPTDLVAADSAAALDLGLTCDVVSEFVVITGMSGAGRSHAADSLEDLGWFVIDNLPPSLVPKVAELALVPESRYSQVALVVGISVYRDDIVPAVRELRDTGAAVRLVFLDADDATLIRRYESTRRRHPLGDNRTVAAAIAEERELLQVVRAEADVVVDTSDLNVHELRARVVAMFGAEHPSSGLQVAVTSFGFKHRTPTDADLLFDCRFLPNPHWDEDLRELTGLDQAVKDFVLGQPQTKEFLVHLEQMLGMLLPAYVAEGKSYLTIGMGCTGGQHRSVVLAEWVAEMIREKGFDPLVTHRDRPL